MRPAPATRVRLGVDVDAAVLDHPDEAWKSVDAVGIDAVARGLGEEAGAECCAISIETKVQHSAVQRVVEVGVRNSQHGSVPKKTLA